MPDRPEIERFHILHKLETEFVLTDGVRDSLHSQLANDDPELINRFMEGFKIEDWFMWVFCAMPWVRLIHVMGQRQFPTRSKSEFQVPDFLMIIETSSLSPQPLLVDVKRANPNRSSLEVKRSQMQLCEAYASAMNLPLAYACYWTKHNVWTLNTPDSFRCKSSTRKLDVVGDVSFLIPPGLARTTVFDSNAEVDGIRHRDFGVLVSDVVELDGHRLDLSVAESTVLDSILGASTKPQRSAGALTTFTDTTGTFHLPKLSNCITRHLAMVGLPPSESLAHASAHIVNDLMTKLGVLVMHLFPEGRTPQLGRIEASFRNSPDPESRE